MEVDAAVARVRARGEDVALLDGLVEDEARRLAGRVESAALPGDVRELCENSGWLLTEGLAFTGLT